MNKAILTIASLIVLVFLGSSFIDRGAAPAIGYRSPELIVDHHDGQTPVVVTAANDKPLLVTFWSASDASSRIDCKMYDNMLREDAELQEQVEYYAINLDRSDAVFSRTCELDRLSAASHIHLTPAEAEKVISDFALSEGFRTLLIGTDGIIKAVNPDKATIEEMIH